MAMEAISTGAAPELARAMKEDPEFSAKGVYQMAVQGDEPAKEIFRRVGWALGIIAADVSNIFNLPMLVIGGGVSSAWEAFAPTLLQEVEKRSFVYRATAPGPRRAKEKSTIITRALLGSDAGLYGAARLPMIEGAPKRRREVRSVS
jgi:glucokinase